MPLALLAAAGAVVAVAAGAVVAVAAGADVAVGGGGGTVGGTAGAAVGDGAAGVEQARTVMGSAAKIARLNCRRVYATNFLRIG
jgi:hypothetical protein